MILVWRLVLIWIPPALSSSSRLLGDTSGQSLDVRWSPRSRERWDSYSYLEGRMAWRTDPDGGYSRQRVPNMASHMACLHFDRPPDEASVQIHRVLAFLATGTFET
jgi:hypothetical protein